MNNDTDQMNSTASSWTTKQMNNDVEKYLKLKHKDSITNSYTCQLLLNMYI